MRDTQSIYLDAYPLYAVFTLMSGRAVSGCICVGIFRKRQANKQIKTDKTGLFTVNDLEALLKALERGGM